MSDTTTEPLSLDDRDALGRLVVELTWRIDHGHADKAHELFAEDGTLALGPTALQGRDELIAWGRERSAQDRRTRHQLGPSRFTATGPGRAEGSTGFTVYMQDGPGPGSTVPMAVGDYHDHFVLDSGGWRFASRKSEVLFSAPG